jgi:hypothetical protein
MASKKKLKREIENLNEALYRAFRAKTAWEKAAEASKNDLDMWRKKHELSQLNLEVKADTEGAFTRGAELAKRTALMNVMNMLQTLQVKEPVNE